MIYYDYNKCRYEDIMKIAVKRSLTLNGEARHVRT